MSKPKRKGAQSPFTDGPSPFVQLPWPMIDSMPFKRLSSGGVWLLVQMMRHYRAGRFILPCRDVRWQMSWAAFDKSRRELIDEGFIVLLERHGLDQKANVYGPSRKWQDRAKDIARDPKAGRIVRRLRHIDGEPRMVSEWEPIKPIVGTRQASQRANWAKARAAMGRPDFGQANIPTKDKRAKRTKREALEDILRIHPVVNEDAPLVAHPVVNDKAPRRSPRGERVIHPVVNEDGASPTSQGKPLTAAHAFALAARIKAGESIEKLRAEVEGGGYRFNIIIPKGAKP